MSSSEKIAPRWTISSLRGNGNVRQGVVTRLRSGLASEVLNAKFAVPPADTCMPAMTFLPSIRANVAGEPIAPCFEICRGRRQIYTTVQYGLSLRVLNQERQQNNYRNKAILQMRCLMECRRRREMKMRLNIAHRPMRNVGLGTPVGRLRTPPSFTSLGSPTIILIKA